MVRVGYRRVSTIDQNTERQLQGVSVNKVFEDHASGRDTHRPALQQALEYLREGDVFVVHSLDRLARNLVDLRNIVTDLNGRGVTVEFRKENLTFSGNDDPTSVLWLNMLGAFAEFERSMILERQREGIALAKAAGKYRGTKQKLTEAQAAKLRRRHEAGEGASALAREFGISRASVYNYRKS